jgi:hypothetical protein
MHFTPTRDKMSSVADDREALQNELAKRLAIINKKRAAIVFKMAFPQLSAGSAAAQAQPSYGGSRKQLSTRACLSLRKYLIRT